MSKAFSLAVVLTVTTGKMLVRDIGEVYEILNFMTGDELFTHQLPRAARECAPHLVRQHPVLSVVNAEHVNGENWRAFLAEQVARIGQALSVEPIPADDHRRVDPIAELYEMRPNLLIIVITPEPQP